VKENKSEILSKAWENREKIFQVTSNAQRFVDKNMRGNKNPIRYLELGEIHVPNHNFTGPGTKIELEHVRNHAPYNEVDACSKIHDLEFNRLFKMPLGKERSEGIRKADREALECYARHKNADGYRLAAGGINTKIALEDLSPTIFDKIMGQAYRGVEPALKAPKKKCKGSRKNRKKCEQRGGSINPETAIQVLNAVAAPLVVGALYGEYRLGKYLYDRLKRDNQVIEPAL
jgi:hypothetical protein